MTAARAASRSAAPRKWNATDGPFASTYSHAGCPAGRDARGERLAPPGRGPRTRLIRGLQPGRIDAARQPAGLEAVIAEILDTADADPRGRIGHGPSGQDRDAEPPRSRRGQGGQAPEGPAGEGLDGRRGWVTRAAREGPVEVGDDQDPAVRREQIRQPSADRAAPTAANALVKV